jgi:hypothetical protein
LKRKPIVRVVACLLGVCGAAAVALPGAQGASPLAAYSKKDTQRFVSAPGLHPPQLKSFGSTKGLAPGDFMLANFKSLSSKLPLYGQGGPMIFNNKLQLIWFRPGPSNAFSMNLTAQTYAGKPALSWWQGVITSTGAVKSGEDMVVDQHYKTIATLKGAGGWTLTPHEMLIDGTDAWVTANKDVSADLSKYGGSKHGSVTDVAVQEYDLTNGHLKSTWSGLDHIPLSQSQAAMIKGAPWDAYHVNSINLVGNNEFLVSMRNTWAGYLVNISTGAIVWTLGGKNSTFKFGKSAKFEWQHDIEMQPGNEVSLFDDACCNLLGGGKAGKPSGPSRGEILKLNTGSHTASLVTQYLYPSKTPAETATQGNAIPLPDGKVIVGWGGLPFFTEFTKAAKALVTVQLPGPDVSYRAYVQRWVGKPSGVPSGAARTKSGKTTVYASWNGATQVASWQVLGGSSANHLSKLAKAKWGGFETRIPVAHSASVLEVEALDSKGHVLASSKTFK